MKGQIMNYQLTTNSIVEYGNRVFPHKEIISKLPDGSWHRYTYADMYTRTKKLASALISKLGVKAGDRVATFAWNHYQHLELYYAIPGAGAICHTVNIRLSVDQVAYIINHAEDTIVFLDATLVPLFEKVSPKTSTVKHHVLINAPAGFQTTLSNTVFYEDLVNSGSGEFEWTEVDENDACCMCYTSGTTGDPKGALYSHRSTYLHAMGIMQPNAGNISANDKVLLIVPQFHVMAWGFPFVCMLAGADMVLPSLHLQPDGIIDILLKEQVTIANGVPAIWLNVYDALKKNPPKEKLSLREYLVGGSALPPSLIEGFENDFGIQGVHAWGMTEISPLGTTSRLQPVHADLSQDDQLKFRAKQGIEVPGVELRVVTEDGLIAPRDGITVGELEVRGAWVIDGYYKFADNHQHFSDDGWFKTGDVGTIDEYGYMMITDRTKDVIKSGGEWISSVALEIALVAHPAIKEACVIAIPDARWTERPLACIVPREDCTISCEELRTFLSGSFANYQLPDRFVMVAEIPKTSVGKLDKKELRRLYANGDLK
ncbi:MAG: long-chain fatty acid--CoA ligase [Ferruginibacter sp.]